jgi:hypothetical protein
LLSEGHRTQPTLTGYCEVKEETKLRISISTREAGSEGVEIEYEYEKFEANYEL